MSQSAPPLSSPRTRSDPDPGYRIRFVTAASLFDGHDASINIIRRLLQASGAEVIHLGHNRSVQEIVDAAKKIAADTKQGTINIEDIDEKLFSGYLNTNGLPDPELLIRTSGEQRISNYLLWQIAYSELYFTPVLWPDFEKNDLYKAIYDYQNRERRFGMTSEQIKNLHGNEE
jgi:undecaprenyl diphosphate synthase